MVILSTLVSTTLDENIRCVSKWFIYIKAQHPELVNLKYVTDTQPIPLSLKGDWIIPRYFSKKVEVFIP